MIVDPKALQLFQLCRPRLRAYFSRKGVAMGDIDDALQEVHLRFAIKLEERVKLREPIRYLFRIARNVRVDYFRQRPPKPVDVDPDRLQAEDEYSGSCALDRAVDSATLHRVMAAALSAEQKAVCMLFHRDRYSQKEISRLMDLKPTKVQTYLKSILELLKEQMGQPASPENDRK